MIVLIVLFSALLLFRALSFVGVAAFTSWHDSGRYALAVMLFFSAVAHFTSMKEDLLRMMPPWVPNPRAMVFLTGLFEIAGGIGLMIPSLQRLAGIALVLFFVAVFPANIRAARTGVTLRGKPATPLWLRAPMQLLLIFLPWWSTH